MILRLPEMARLSLIRTKLFIMAVPVVIVNSKLQLRQD